MRLLLSLALVHLGALIIVALVPGYALLRLWLAALIVLSAAWHLAVQGWRRLPGSIMEVMRSDAGDWELVLATGEVLPARLLASSFIGQHLVILNFALGHWRRLSLPLATDSLEAEVMRQLRAQLRAGRWGENNRG
ncbi:hypothetical protein CKO36_14390 [Rhabdochromatium marinum]|nr:hypothetical protein [Rhabdochromatium marinum]